MSVVATLVPLQATVFALAALGATAVVLSRDPLRQVVVNGFYGYVLVAVFVVLQAPDVALSMLVVGAVGYPLVILIAVARVRAGKSTEGDEGGDEPGERRGE